MRHHRRVTEQPGPTSVQRAPGLRGPVAAWALAMLLVTTGTWHFASPSGFEAIVPHVLGAPAFWVYASGAAEIACGLALAARPVRRLGALAASALFVVVFPANIQMALDSGAGDHGLLHNPVVEWARLPLQIPLVVWAVYIVRTSRAEAPVPRHRERHLPAPMGL